MRKMGKAIISMVLAGAMAAMTAGCSNQPVNTNTAAASGGGTTSEDGTVTIRFGGGPSSSANYTTFAGIGNLIMEDHPN